MHCQQHVLTEKYLICPSLRTGQMWLDRAAALGQNPMNVRLRTVKSLAFELAEPLMRKYSLIPVNPSQSFVIMNRILLELDQSGASYFSRTRISINLVSGMLDTINTLRQAGITSDRIGAESFDVHLKGLNIKQILQDYENRLKLTSLTDYADVLRLAAEGLDKRFAESTDRLIMVPDDTECSKLEQELLDAVPGKALVSLETDTPDERIRQGVTSDCDLLAYFRDPHEAPEASADGTSRIFHSLGHSNEIREILRRIIMPLHDHDNQEPLPFDNVEILHTDFSTYVPVIYETVQSVMMSLNDEFENLPVTFAEGIPVRLSRPAKALNTWIKWVTEGYPQTILVDMISDGLISVDPVDDPPDSSELARVLRNLKIVSGLNRTGEMLRSRLEDLQSAKLSCGRNEFTSFKRTNDRDLNVEREIRYAQALISIFDRLAVCSQPDTTDLKKQLYNCLTFLKTCARSYTEIDNYGLQSLVRHLEEMSGATKSEETTTGLDIMRWAQNLTENVRIMGSGSRPGMIHVDNIYSGGHTGRSHTFIVGLDDERFPGSGTHDPLLMDDERKRISEHLPQSRREPGRRIDKFGRLLSRLSGNVTLSYSCKDIHSDRSSFPGSALFSIFRILSNQRESDQSGMLEWLGLPASFAPVSRDAAMTVDEWLLSALCGQEIGNRTELVTDLKPGIRYGLNALESRLSDEFTIYDGNIGPVDYRHDPARPDGPVMSTASLETIGSCPLRYFFKYILRIRPLESISPDPSTWLDNLHLGLLLHETFYSFMSELSLERRRPNLERDKGRIFKILDQQLDSHMLVNPPPNKSSMRRQVIWLEKSALVFLVEEEISSRQWTPFLLEASIGLKNRDDSGSVERESPVMLQLSGGKKIRVSGKIDRVDKNIENPHGVFRIIDYKTGNPKTYQDAKNYQRGKIVQHAIYLHIANNVLRSPSSQFNATCDFVFFFPTVRAHGLKILKQPQDMHLSAPIIDSLCDIVSTGVFLPTNDQQTCLYCDYSLICGDKSVVARCASAKLDNPLNSGLDPVRKIFLHA